MQGIYVLVLHCFQCLDKELKREWKISCIIVEDDTEIANAIKIYLQNQGYDVYVGNDGLEGLEIIEKETIHLAIVDIMMPRMDGLTMVSKLRERYDFPVIFSFSKIRRY